MALVQGPVSPGYRITVVNRDQIDQEELASFIGHKGEPWVGDMVDRWNDPEFDGYNLTAIAYKIRQEGTEGYLAPELVAHAWLGLDGDTGLLGHIYTHPQHRGHGLATSLCHTLIEVFFRERAGSFLVLGTDNPTAARIYKSLGFYPVRSDSSLPADENMIMARGVYPGFDSDRAYLGNVNRRTIHINFEHEYFSNNGGICVIESIHPRHIAGCTMLMNAPAAAADPKLPGMSILTGAETELAVVTAIRAHKAGRLVCAVAVDSETRRVHALGIKRTGKPGSELSDKADVYSSPSSAAAEHTLRQWIDDRVMYLNQGVLLEGSIPSSAPYQHFQIRD